MRRSRPDPWHSLFIGELFLFRSTETYHQVLTIDASRWPDLPLVEQFMEGHQGWQFEDIRREVFPLIGR